MPQHLLAAHRLNLYRKSYAAARDFSLDKVATTTATQHEGRRLEWLAYVVGLQQRNAGPASSRQESHTGAATDRHSHGSAMKHKQRERRKCTTHDNVTQPAKAMSSLLILIDARDVVWVEVLYDDVYLSHCIQYRRSCQLVVTEDESLFHVLSIACVSSGSQRCVSGLRRQRRSAYLRRR